MEEKHPIILKNGWSTVSTTKYIKTVFPVMLIFALLISGFIISTINLFFSFSTDNIYFWLILFLLAIPIAIIFSLIANRFKSHTEEYHVYKDRIIFSNSIIPLKIPFSDIESIKLTHRLNDKKNGWHTLMIDAPKHQKRGFSISLISISNGQEIFNFLNKNIGLVTNDGIISTRE